MPGKARKKKRIFDIYPAHNAAWLGNRVKGKNVLRIIV